MATKPEGPPAQKVFIQRVIDFRNRMINQQVLRFDVRPCHTLEGPRRRYALIGTVATSGHSPCIDNWLWQCPSKGDFLKMRVGLWVLVQQDQYIVFLFSKGEALRNFVVRLTNMYAHRPDLRPRAKVQLEMYGDEGEDLLRMRPPGTLLEDKDLNQPGGPEFHISRWMDSLCLIDLDAVLTIYLHFQRPCMNYSVIRSSTKLLRDKQLSSRVRLLLDEDTFRDMIPEYQFHCRMTAVVIPEPAGTYTFSAGDGFTPPTIEGIGRLEHGGARYPGWFTSTENVSDDAELEPEVQFSCLNFTMPE